MSSEYSTWLENARALPVAFAQVREDPRLDLAVVERLPDDANVVMIGSGGCTAAVLACNRKLSQLHVVDPNPSQIALCKVKLHLLKHFDPQSRLAVLGHSKTTPDQRAQMVEEFASTLGLQTSTFGPIEVVSRLGLDYCGRYEAVFSELQREIASSEDFVRDVLKLSDISAQRTSLENGRDFYSSLTVALNKVMSQSNLVALFGEDATNNGVIPFSDHFRLRLQESIRTLPNASNPYIWQFLAGRYPADIKIPWLHLSKADYLAQVRFRISTITEELSAYHDEVDFVHLSNVLDWLSEEEASKTLRLAFDALREGGFVLIRQLNSTSGIRNLSSRFHWLEHESARLHSMDRSFFYRAIHLGRK